MFTNLYRRLATFTLLLIVASACQAAAETSLKGAGATFPHPLYQKWFRDYSSVDPETRFHYEAVGSGAGIKAILSESVDFGASDKFLSDAELAKAPGQLLHIPTVLGAVAVAYNIPGVRTGLKLTPEILSGIFSGKITRWNDPVLERENPRLSLPDRTIVVVHRSDASGTTSIFTDYLSKVSGNWAKEVGTGTSVTWPTGTGVKGNQGMVLGIKETPYSIGYLEIAYAIEHELATAALRNKSGSFVRPTMLSTRAAAVGLKKLKGDYRVSLVNQVGKDVYPIVGLTWLLVYQQQKDAEKGKKLVDFLHWQLRKAEKLTSTLYYTPLPKSLADQVEQTIRSITYPR
jgi:phosphate transport system substrate-binding protein